MKIAVLLFSASAFAQDIAVYASCAADKPDSAITAETGVRVQQSIAGGEVPCFKVTIQGKEGERTGYLFDANHPSVAAYARVMPDSLNPAHYWIHYFGICNYEHNFEFALPDVDIKFEIGWLVKYIYF